MVYQIVDYRDANYCIILPCSRIPRIALVNTVFECFTYSHLIIYLDHGSTHSAPALMSPLDNPDWTLRENIKMHEASFHTEQTDVNDDNEDTRARAMLPNREGGEDESDGWNRRCSKRKLKR